MLPRASGKDLILAADDLPRQEVDVPEWGCSVLVRTMTAGERDAWEVAYMKDRTSDMRARLAAATVCDEAGDPMFTLDDIPALTRKSAAALNRIMDVAMRLNGFTKEDVDKLEGN